MKHLEPGIRLHIGTSGAGKTYGLRTEVYAAARDGMRVIVIDRMHEWTHADAFVGTTKEAIAAIASGARLVVVARPGLDPAVEVEAACQWACAGPETRGVAFAEAHAVAPSMGRLTPHLMDVATAWRHYTVALWIDTQRVATLSRTITEQARTVRIFAVIGDRDRAAMAELAGTTILAAIDECVAHLAAGRAGYHIELGLVRVPPAGGYVVRR